MSDWLVTTPHRVRDDEAPLGFVPYGKHHARRGGDPRTLCGLVAFDWPIFWTRHFDVDSVECCLDCIIALARESTPRQPSSSKDGAVSQTNLETARHREYWSSIAPAARRTPVSVGASPERRYRNGGLGER